MFRNNTACLSMHAFMNIAYFLCTLAVRIIGQCAISPFSANENGAEIHETRKVLFNNTIRCKVYKTLPDMVTGLFSRRKVETALFVVKSDKPLLGKTFPRCKSYPGTGKALIILASLQPGVDINSCSSCEAWYIRFFFRPPPPVKSCSCACWFNVTETEIHYGTE